MHRAGCPQRQILVELRTSYRSIRAVVRDLGTFRPFLEWEPAPGRLTLDEREEIGLGLARGESFAGIARGLCRVTSTVSREVGATAAGRDIGVELRRELARCLRTGRAQRRPGGESNPRAGSATW